MLQGTCQPIEIWENMMGTVGVVLLVAFVIVCALLVLLVLVQDDGSRGMGGLLGGRGTAAFGSHSASVLTRTTFTLVVLFFALALSLALLNRRSSVRRDLAPAAGVEASNATESKKWYEEQEEEKESVIEENSEESEAAPLGEGGERQEATNAEDEETEGSKDVSAAPGAEQTAGGEESEETLGAGSEGVAENGELPSPEGAE